MAYNFGYQQNRGFKVIPVANEFEMNNITVDFNGMPTYFHNQNSNEIYIKQFDIKTGATTIQKFIKSDNAGHELTGVNPETGVNIYEEKLNAINERLDGLYELIENKGAKK
jgi:hypothetical protein